MTNEDELCQGKYSSYQGITIHLVFLSLSLILVLELVLMPWYHFTLSQGSVHIYGIKEIKIYVRLLIAVYESKVFFSAPKWKEGIKPTVEAGMNGEDGKDGIDGPQGKSINLSSK